MKLVRFHSVADIEIYVEMESVSSLHKSLDDLAKTTIIMNNGMRIEVKESMVEVLSLFRNQKFVASWGMGD